MWLLIACGIDFFLKPKFKIIIDAYIKTDIKESKRKLLFFFFFNLEFFFYFIFFPIYFYKLEANYFTIL